MTMHAVVWRTVNDTATILTTSFGGARTFGEALATARAWFMVAFLWSGFQAMKMAAVPIQM